MFVIETDLDTDNSNAIKFSPTQEELDIIALDPSMWIESSKGAAVSGSNVLQINDRTGRTQWLPKLSNLPKMIKSANGQPVLNFGLNRGPSNPGALIAANGYEPLPQNGVFTLVKLTRVPQRNTGGYGGTGGDDFGNNGVAPELLRLRFRSDGYEGNILWYNHGSVSPANDTNYQIIASFTDDYAWHVDFIEVTTVHHRWERDGVLLQQKEIPAIPFNTPGSRQVVIGSAGADGRNGFFGDFAAAILVPRTVTAEEKALLMGRMNAIKSTL